MTAADIFSDIIMQITTLDHIVLTVTDPDRTAAFYNRVLGMQTVTFAGDRRALIFGGHKINLHKAGEEVSPHAGNPTPGSADLCLITEVPMQQVMAHLRACAVGVIAGPTERAGATGGLLSIYIRDPDANLIEIANRVRDRLSETK